MEFIDGIITPNLRELESFPVTDNMVPKYKLLQNIVILLEGNLSGGLSGGDKC